MAMRVSREEFLDIDEPLKPSFENVAAKMALDFEAEVFLRLKRLGLKRKDLAQLLNVSPAAISKLLTENSNMTLKTMAKIATALGCEVAPLRLNDVADVSYIDLGNEIETSTAQVSYDFFSVASVGDELFGSDTLVANDAVVMPASSTSSVIPFRKVAA